MISSSRSGENFKKKFDQKKISFKILGGSVWSTLRGARDLRFWLGILLYI